MWKLQSLRSLIESAVPELKRDPERLIVMATDGAAVSTLAGGLSFEYRYTAAITVLDYTGHTDALFVPILAWVRVNQSDVLDNPTSQSRGIELLALPEIGNCSHQHDADTGPDGIGHASRYGSQRQ